MTRARARSLWLAGSVFIAACSSSPGTTTPTTTPTSPAPTPTAAATPAATAATPITETLPVASTATPTSDLPPPTLATPSTLVPIDPAVLIPIAIGNKPFPAPADDLATDHHGFTGDPNAMLAGWQVTPMAVPSGSDVRLLGFERTVGINTTTATYLTGAIDPDATLAMIQAQLAPSPTYTVTPSTRTDGTVTIHSFDAQPTTVQGEPPGWQVEASVVDQLGIVRIKRNDYSFDKVVPAFSDLPATLQPAVLNQDAIAVNIGGVLSSIAYEYGVSALGDSPARRTRLGYDIPTDFPTATANLKRLLTTGWSLDEQTDAVYFTSPTTSEVWTLDDFGGTTHLTYDTGG